MLSIENPPPDPPYQQQLVTNNNHERASSPNQNLPLPDEVLENLDHSTYPKFCLRDYVFSARSKDIRNNWPFSLKNLQLCLKHGVKDLLPPFQPPEFVRNRSISERTSGKSTTAFQNISIFDGELSNKPEEHRVELEPDSLDGTKLEEKRVQTCLESSSWRCEGENGFSSTMTTSVSQRQTDLVSASGPSSSSLKTDNLLERPVEVEISELPVTQKTESKLKTPGKRCKFIRKSANHVDQNSAADIAMTFTAISESMASKTCPVCKTFSSSSNTTLNAHIDQCLSMESTPNCTLDSKLTRYKIKPRKTKLMVDIYATARMCTLEELDRRNGTTWATLTGFPAKDVEKSQIHSVGKKQKVVSVQPEDVGNAGAVYIDAYGTKLRILSKFSSPSSLLKAQEDQLGSRKLKGVDETRFRSAKNKKCFASKQLKYYKIASQSRKNSSLNGISSQVHEAHEQGKGSSDLEVHKIKKQVKPHDSGTFRQWPCSKRTRLVKVTRQEGYQPSRLKWNLSEGAMVDTDHSFMADTSLERSQAHDRTDFSENYETSPESSERTDNESYEACMSDKNERSPVKKSLRSSFSGEMIDRTVPKQMNKIINRRSKGSCFDGKNSLVKLHNAGEQTKDYEPSDVPPSYNNKPSRNCHVSAFKDTKLISSRRKLSNYGKARDRFWSHGEESISWHSQSDQSGSSSEKSSESQSAMEEVTEVVSPRESGGLKNRRERKAARKYGGHREKKYMDAEIQEKTEDFARKGISICREDVSMDSSSKLGPKENTCFCKSVDSQFQKLNNNLKTRCGTFQSTQDCSWPLCGDETRGFNESSFGHGHEMFFSGEDHNVMIGRNGQSGGELDSEDRQGNSFFEVDPISIPGPPGSFLPSPRDMRSEEFQGNSSLSNSWVHSCQDQQDLVDGDSSGSPISATSTISNSTGPRPCLKYNNTSGVSDVFRDKLESVSPKARALLSVENDVGLPHVTCTGAGRINGDAHKVNKTFVVERGPVGVTYDNQPCCCQRADRIFQGVNVTYQEPHRGLASETIPAMGRKQISYCLNTRPNGLDIMSEGSSQHSMLENIGSSAMKLPTKSLSPSDGFPNKGLTFPRSGNCEPAGPPPTSNPVLRLMGKNLMVVNKDDEDISVPVEQPQSQQHSYVHTQAPTFAGGFSRDIQYQASSSSPWPHHQDSSKDQNARNIFGQSFDLRLPKGFKNPANLSMPQSVQVPTDLFLKQQTDSGFTDSYTYRNGYNFHPRKFEAMNWAETRQNKASTHSTSSAMKMSVHHQQMNSLSATNGIKEINIIGGARYCEDSLANNPKYSGSGRTMQILTPGASIPLTSSGQVNTFPSLQDALTLDKPTSICNPSFQSVPSRQDHSSPVKWDCTSEAPYVRRRGVF